MNLDYMKGERAPYILENVFLTSKILCICLDWFESSLVQSQGDRVTYDPAPFLFHEMPYNHSKTVNWGEAEVVPKNHETKEERVLLECEISVLTRNNTKSDIKNIY